MQVEEELARLSPRKDTVLTIGVFDGVHLGHKYLISQLKEHARQQGLLSGVITFHRHPVALLSSRTTLPYLTDLATRNSLLKNEGVDYVIVLSFARELAQLSARDFVIMLKKYLRMRGLLVGTDFALGRNREGNIATLRKLGQEMDFSVTVVPPIMIDGRVVSSTSIRNALAKGDTESVLNLTGRPFSLHGHIISGTGRGQGLGFPTANLDIDPQQALPEDGVYATRAYIDKKAYKSMTNIGQNPTFGGTKRTVEVYILDYHDNLYGRELKIDIIKRLRRERKFDTAQQLEKQIAEDVKQGRAILDS
jgi:riboflavin kinase/FMN adenylyltransferase